MIHPHFHDLTHLLGYYKDKKYIKDGDWKMYKLKITKYVNKNVDKYSEHDILFVGSSYESRQYYGFSKLIKKDGLLVMNVTFENPDEAFGENVSYTYAINELRQWWSINCEKLFYTSCDFDQAFSNIL